jgi:hypothetical protein
LAAKDRAVQVEQQAIILLRNAFRVSQVR